jgi:hypothetical protein
MREGVTHTYIYAPPDILTRGSIRRDAQHGAIVGLPATGEVISSVGCVLAGTFAVLATIPATFLTEIGVRGRVRHSSRHDRGAVAARHCAEPGRRPVDVVAQQAGAQTRPGNRRARRRERAAAMVAG